MIKRGISGAVVALTLIALFSGSGLGQEKKELSLTLEDSIVRALKNNLNVAAEVINPGLAEANVAYAKQMFSPTMEIGLQGDRFEQLSTWSLQSAGTYINRSTSATTSLTQQIPFGGTMTASLSYDYTKNNQLYQSYNPSYGSRLNFALTQPLLKNFGYDVSRREIIVAQNNLAASRSQFKDILIRRSIRSRRLTGTSSTPSRT